MSKWVDAKAKVSEVDFLTPTVPTNMQEEAMVMREGRRVRDEALTSRNVMISCPTTQGRRADLNVRPSTMSISPQTKGMQRSQPRNSRSEANR